MFQNGLNKSNTRGQIVFSILTSLVLFTFIFYLTPIIISLSDRIRAIPGNTPSILSEICILTFSLIFILLFSRTRIKRFGFTRTPIKGLLKPLGLVVIIYGGFFIVRNYFSITNTSNLNVSLFTVIAFYWLLPSISEEIFIRGLIQTILSPTKVLGFRIFKRRINFAVLMSTVYFMILHIWILHNPLSNIFLIVYFINITFVGFLTSYYRDKTDSLITSLLIHLTVNFFSVLLPVLV